MTRFFGYKPLTKSEDWQGLAGDGKWVPGRSAYELACAWQVAGGLPVEIRGSLDGSPWVALHGLTLDLCLVEKPVFLDTRHGPSMTDLMGYGRNSKGEPVVLAVEGKADEVFGPRVASWVRGNKKDTTAPPRPSRKDRLEFLGKHLGSLVGVDSPLRYQLIHRTVSAVLEAQLHGASAVLVLVHAFEVEAAENWRDFEEFMEFIGGGKLAKKQVSGAVLLGETKNVATHFLWWQQPIASTPNAPAG